jgi:putative protein-disulfide isomerase
MEYYNGFKFGFGEKPTEIIYVYDALCGWCYGFRPVILKLYEEFQGDVDFLILSGGMIRGESITPVSAIAPYIRSAYQGVEETCNVKFGENFLEGLLNDDQAIFTSVPAAHALAVFRKLKPRESFYYASDIQLAIYFDGMKATDEEGMAGLAVRYGLDAQNFLSMMNSPEIEEIVNYEFKLVESIGVNGFPSVYFKKENQIELISQGYNDFDSLAGGLLNHLGDAED